MKDEIKEILNIIECWKNGDYVLAYSFNYDRAGKQNDKILDYITNLQEEIEKYKNYVDETFLYTYEELQDKVINLQEENEKVHKELDYADNYNIYLISKIDKAIEYGKELRLFDNESVEFEIGTNFINILQGEDKDE